MLKVRISLLLICVLTTLTGCTNEGKDFSEESVTLRVLHFSEEIFREQVGEAFLAKHPNLKFQVIPIQLGLTYDQYVQLVEKERPDIVINIPNINKFIEEGRLLSLESYIRRSESIDLDKINEHIVSYWRQLGLGEIYAASPEFAAKAIYFNKDLFRRFGIKEPFDQMSWTELLETLSLFPHAALDEEGLYGLFYDDDHPWWVFNEIVRTSNLPYWDGRVIDIMNDEWKEIMNRVITAYQAGTIPPREVTSVQSNMTNAIDPFVAGKAGMIINNSNYINKLQNVEFEWEIVTLPIDPKYPNEGASVTSGVMWGINRGSPYADTAWKVIEYILGEDYAKIHSKNQRGSQLSIYKQYSSRNGIDLSPFYKLAPTLPNSYNELYATDVQAYTRFQNQFNENVKDVITRIVEGEQSLDAALTELQRVSQFELDQLWERLDSGEPIF